MSASRPIFQRRWFYPSLLIVAVGLYAWAVYEPPPGQFDSEYIGSGECKACHTQIYPLWKRSPHANIARRATSDSVIGQFDNHQWFLPENVRRSTLDNKPAARMYQQDGDYYMALRQPDSAAYTPFKIEYVIGYQYRQTYLTRETGGVLRRLPLQWSPLRNEFFPYWNEQEKSPPSSTDLWAQMRTQNSAWNLFCARCHTTHLEILDKDVYHTRADTRWVEEGIACEACHGPGSNHRDYFASNYVNRIIAFLDSKLRDEPVAYMVNARKLDKGQATSVCGRCHGADIFAQNQDLYRLYEPGRSREGRINDLSDYYRQAPLTPGRDTPTVEVWDDGEPKGIGMLFRSFVESSCFQQAEVRCYDCHNPHDNKMPTEVGILKPSEISNQYCLKCHQALATKVAEHTRHTPGESGSYCYDCHMPKTIFKLASGVEQYARTHKMSTIPNPLQTLRHGMEGSPNACNQCHSNRDPAWSLSIMQQWQDQSAL
ncbi:MAG: hypothetical protein Tsb002_08870 [Wenzhouxiangellaceae bacterium]